MLIVWTLLLFFLTYHACIGFEKIHFSKYFDIKSFATLSAIGLKDCIEECKARPKCASINYKRAFHLCYLLDGVDSLNNPTVVKRGLVYVRKSEWSMVRQFEFEQKFCDGQLTYPHYYITGFFITKSCLYKFHPLKPHFYRVGSTGVYIIFLISAQKHRL